MGVETVRLMEWWCGCACVRGRNGGWLLEEQRAGRPCGRRGPGKGGCGKMPSGGGQGVKRCDNSRLELCSAEGLRLGLRDGPHALSLHGALAPARLRFPVVAKVYQLALPRRAPPETHAARTAVCQKGAGRFRVGCVLCLTPLQNHGGEQLVKGGGLNVRSYSRPGTAFGPRNCGSEADLTTHFGVGVLRFQ